MNTQIATSQTFQERMFERIKDQMGDLLTEEDLKKMVDAAIQKAFFDPIVVRKQYGVEEVRPSAFVQMIEQVMKEQVNKEIKAWVDDHPEEIAKVLNEAMEKGMFKMALSYFEQKVDWPMREMMTKLQQKGVL